MSKNAITKKFFLEPGYVCVPYEPMQLAAVVASGVVVTIFNRKTHRGGMSVYTHPKRVKGNSTAVFAAPAISALVQMFTSGGDDPKDLEAHLCGGAINKESMDYVPLQSEENIRIGEEVLKKLNVELSGKDSGGIRGRKVVFHSGTGEIVTAKVSNIRRTDWYPPYDPQERRERESDR